MCMDLYAALNINSIQQDMAAILCTHLPDRKSSLTQWDLILSRHT